MIECYYKWCQHHMKDEPFCDLTYCVASESQIVTFQQLRNKEIAKKHRVNPDE